MPVSPDVTRRLHALRNRVAEGLETIQRSRGREVERNYYDPLVALEWFATWDKIRSNLIANDPEFADVPVRTAPTPSTTTDFDGRGYIVRREIERLRDDIENVWDVLTHPSRQASQFTLDREGVFVAGQAFDAMLAITSIIRTAKIKIVVVDGYVSEKTLDLLTAKGDPVAVEILTKSQSATPAFKQHAQAFAAQYKNLLVRTTAHFHDRFVVVDDTDYYHFGASIKDAARHTFMFSRIEEPSMITTLKTDYAQEWARATVVI